jgi:hypothetical protein
MTFEFLREVQAKLIARDKFGELHYFEPITEVLLVFPIGGTLASCDLFDIPSTSHWTAAAIIVQ